MPSRIHFALTALALLSPQIASARTVRVMESAPKAESIIDGQNEKYIVRFDGPVDHRASSLRILHDGHLIRSLHPSLTVMRRRRFCLHRHRACLPATMNWPGRRGRCQTESRPMAPSTLPFVAHDEGTHAGGRPSGDTLDIISVSSITSWIVATQSEAVGVRWGNGPTARLGERSGRPSE